MFKIISWGGDLFICWKPRIQIYKWFPQGNKNELGNFILLIPQIYYFSKVLSSGDTSLKQLHFLPISYNIKTRFFGHKSEALWHLASAYLVNLIIFFLLPSCLYDDLVGSDHSPLSNINFVIHSLYLCLCYSFNLERFHPPLYTSTSLPIENEPYSRNSWSAISSMQHFPIFLMFQAKIISPFLDSLDSLLIPLLHYLPCSVTIIVIKLSCYLTYLRLYFLKVVLSVS